MKILLGVSGSIAATLAPKIARAFSDKGIGLSWIFTKAASNICIKNVSLFDSVELDEFQHYKDTGEVLHISLRREYDAFVIAPLSANTLAKVSNGLCDSVLTNVARCWDYDKPMILVPAMNTMMWHNPITARQLNIMKDLGATVVDPVYKTLACGDTGIGAMAHINDIVKEVENQCLASH